MLPAIPSLTPLVESIRNGALDPARAVADAVARKRPDDGVAPALAASIAGQPLDAAVIAPLLPTASDYLAMPVLVGSCAGDRAAMLLDLVESDSMTSDREAMALLLAVRIGFGRKTTQLTRFHTQLRLVARRCSGGDDASLLLAAGRAAKDPGAVRVVNAVADLADAEGDAFAKDVIEAFESPREALPREAARQVAAGFTVTRAAPKIGRNDPCYCGSGKKFKKCCEGKKVEGDAPASSPAGYVRVREPITAERLATMPIDEVAALDLATLEPDVVVKAMNVFISYRRWEEAERAVDHVIARALPDTDADDLRDQVIAAALDAKRIDVARSQRAKMKGDLDPVTALRIELFAPTKFTFAHVDALAQGALASDPTLAVDFAHGLLATHPALGIYLARGAIDPTSPLDSEMLLDRIEEARDRLGLPPGDPWQKIYDEALDRDIARHAAEAEVTARGEHLAAEAESLRAQARLAASRVSELEARLHEQERTLRDVAAPKGKGREGKEGASSAAAAERLADEERARLRAKIEELKSRVAAGNEERASLRKELARTNDELASSAAKPNGRPGEAPPAQEEEPREEPGEGASAPRELLVPRITRAAESTLRAVPIRAAREALDTVMALATGDPLAWSEVKRLVRVARPVYEGRIGIHYRVLFAIDGKALDVLEIVHRKDLRTAVDRYV